MAEPTPTHIRWATNCANFPRRITGPDVQYLVDWHRGNLCPVCPVPESDDLGPRNG